MKLDEKDQQILAAWELHDVDDISTERLLQMVADDCDCDVGRVTDALFRRHLAEKRQ